jgi:hypothetical protein
MLGRATIASDRGNDRGVKYCPGREAIPVTASRGTFGLLLQVTSTFIMTTDDSGPHEIAPGFYLFVKTGNSDGGIQRLFAQLFESHGCGFPATAALLELWYASYDRVLEHLWSQVLANMSGSEIPIPRFGATNCPQPCPAHLIRFPTKPNPTAFRWALLQRNASHPPVYVQPMVVPVIPNDDNLSLWAPYQRGRVYLEEWRREACCAPNAESVAFSRQHGAKRLVLRVASKLQVSEAQLRREAKLALAIEELVGNCGERALQAIFDPGSPQTEKRIMQLSRTADTRQQYRIDGVLAGRFRSIAPYAADPVYDTKCFAEILSRLRRARGTLEDLAAELGQGRIDDSDVACELFVLASLCGQAAGLLRDSLAAEPWQRHKLPATLERQFITQHCKRPDITGRTVGKARQALKLTIKSLWDSPEFAERGIQGTDRERLNTQLEIGRVIQAAGEVELQVRNRPRQGGSPVDDIDSRRS